MCSTVGGGRRINDFRAGDVSAVCGTPRNCQPPYTPGVDIRPIDIPGFGSAGEATIPSVMIASTIAATSDITYIRLKNEFVYLAVILDSFSRRVVGWALRRELKASLPLAALRKTFEERQPGPG